MLFVLKRCEAHFFFIDFLNDAIWHFFIYGIKYPRRLKLKIGVAFIALNPTYFLVVLPEQ